MVTRTSHTMPSILRASAMPAIITREPSPPKVSFKSDLIEGISRPINDKESRALYDFEYHAQRCRSCHNPYEAYRQGHQLCPTGHQLAQDVAIYLYNQDGDIFSNRDEKIVRVEIPTGYEHTIGLLKAIERSLRSRSRSSFVSLDRTYDVPPRTPERRKSVKVDQIKKERRQSRAPEVVEWAAVTPATSSTSKRGSLYERDLEQHRRDYSKYNIEVREPTNRTSGYYK